MSIYKIPIEYAFIIFPIIAFFLTLPFLIQQYRKYGSIPVLRAIIFYSFILYLLTAYFMVILPLPDRLLVAKMTSPSTQLIPFSFIGDIIKEVSLKSNNLPAYISILKNNAIYTVIFNLLLTLPFGVYLRYYFGCKWYKVILYSFLLSLFFELTQLSGLYGFYPRPYRLFDVDDLIVNTVGGLIGFIITPIFMKILPSRKELDTKSYKKGTKVTLFRRIVAIEIDIFFFAMLILTMQFITYNLPINKFSFLISIIIYYLLIPTLNEGKTLGKRVLKIKVVSENGSKAKRYQILARYLLGYVLIIFYPIFSSNLKSYCDNAICTVINYFISMYVILNYLSLFLVMIKKEKYLLYEKITKTKDFSTIVYEEENSDIIKQDDKPQIENSTKNLNINKEGENNVRDKKNK